jgi:TraM recognition site of TraD and TraG
VKITHEAHRALARGRHYHHVAHADHVVSGPPGTARLFGGMAYLAGVSWLPAVLLAVVAVLAGVVMRVWGRHRLARAGCWFEVRLGEEVSRPGLESFLRTLAHGLRRPLLGAVPWVALSVSAEEDRAACGLFVSGGLSAPQVRSALEQALGGVTVDAAAGIVQVGDVGGQRRVVASVRAVGSSFLPLRVDQRVDPAGQLLAALRAHAAGEGGVIQLVFQAPPRSARTRARSQAARLRAGQGLGPSGGARVLGAVGEALGGVLDVVTPSSPHPMGRQTARAGADQFSLECARAIEAKASGPLFAATVRVGAWASGRRRARSRLGGLLAAFGQYQELSGLRRGREPFCGRRMAACLPSVRPRLLLGCGEAAALVAVPQQSALAPLSFTEAPSRRVAPVAQAPSRGLLLGRSDHSGFDREVRVEPRALLQHTHVLGPTGRGKSTLILNMTVEAIQAGMGGMVLDPTGELTGLILDRIPQDRQSDVDLLDLGDERFPPALNLLACPPAQGDAQVQAICGIFARLFARFWGPRTEDILRSALATLLCNRRPDSEPPTLADVFTLLSNPGERANYRASDPVALDVFWRQWQTLSEPARVHALAPLSNKLRALLGNRMLRNMLCQPAAPDLGHTITHGRWLLVSLPQTLGEDAADLVGSVLLHRAWQAAQRLGPIATNDRPPFLCLVDECHRFCHLPQGMATALAQARGYGVGFVLAHQHLAQVSDHGLAEAIDANCQTKICFALQAADAKRMAPHFEPRLDAYDLQHLGSYTIACRVLHEARELPAATAATLPPSKPTPGGPAKNIRERARESAHERSAVEAAIRARYGRIEQPPPGRADADQPMQARSPTGLDDGFAGDGELIEDECFAGIEGSPCVIPSGSPPNGGLSASGTPHHDTGRRRSANPDSRQFLPPRRGRSC